MPYVSVAGEEAFYAHRRPRQAGSAPVVFVHGAGGTHQHWLRAVQDLPKSPSYAPDLPGHGRSRETGRDSIPAYSRWLLAFLDTVGLDRAVLVGHSMGGAVVLDAALRAPCRVTGLGLVATGARLRVAPSILEAIGQDIDAAVQRITTWAFGPQAQPELVRLGRQQLASTPPAVLLGDYAACDAFNVMDRLHEVQAPTVVVCGTQDRLTPPKYATLLRDRIAGATLHLVEGSGHMVLVEQPAAVAQALSAFLSGL